MLDVGISRVLFNSQTWKLQYRLKYQQISQLVLPLLSTAKLQKGAETGKCKAIE